MKKNEKNPAIVFANSLGSQKSSKTTLRVIDYLCRIYNNSDHNSLDWASFDFLESIIVSIIDNRLSKFAIK